MTGGVANLCMDTRQTFKLTIWSFIKPGLWPIIAVFLTCILLFPIAMIAYDKEGFLLFAVSFALLLFLAVIPPLILHINYFINDRGTRLIYDESSQQVDYISLDRVRTFNVNEIRKIEKYQFKDPDEDSAPLTPWSAYYFYIIYLGDTDCFFVSRMIIEKLESKFEPVECVSIKRVFPIMLKKSALRS